MTQREGVLDATHEILERLEAHLRAADQLTVCILSHFFPLHFIVLFRFILTLLPALADFFCSPSYLFADYAIIYRGGDMILWKNLELCLELATLEVCGFFWVLCSTNNFRL